MEYYYKYNQEGRDGVEQVLLSKPVVTCREEHIINSSSSSSGGIGRNDAYSLCCNYIAARERKLVCVTSGNSYLGVYLIKELLSHGYLVRATVQNQGDLEDMKRLMMNACNDEIMMGRLESIVVAKIGNLEALCDAFRGCHVVFHTSSFIDPRGLSGYTERTAFLETEGAKNVIEACGRTAYVKRCVFTSSLLSCIWNDRNDAAEAVVDERSWSDEDFCRDNKLWLALGKTRAESAAWTKSNELKIRLITICPGLVMSPSFPHAETSLPYLKGGRIMLSRGLLATEDVVKLARTQVQIYEAMDNGTASGRYITYERAVDSLESAEQVESELKMQGMLTGGFDGVMRGKVTCGRVKRLLLDGGNGRVECRRWEVKR